MKTRAGNEFEIWKAEGHWLTIEYATPVMEEIRSAVVDGFLRIARGGVEVGGVLFGKRKGDRVRILASRPLACEYASGPSFVLSEKDRDALRRLLDTSQDPGLKDMTPVGWYHSHTRSEICFSEADVAIHDLYFPEPWQVALVLRPERLKPVRAGFFVSEPGGGLRAEASCREFTLEPLARMRTQSGRTAGGHESVAGAPFVSQQRQRLWTELLLLAAALILLLAGAGAAVHPYLFPPQPKPVAVQPNPLLLERDELRRQADGLRLELDARDARIRELEASVEGLRKQLARRQSNAGSRGRGAATSRPRSPRP